MIREDKEGIMLSSDGLLSKFGFNDGDIISDCEDKGKITLKVGTKQAYHKDVLCEVVERLLVPAMPVKVKTYRISSIHNPIRVENEYRELLQAIPTIRVVIPFELIQSIINKIAEEVDDDE